MRILTDTFRLSLCIAAAALLAFGASVLMPNAAEAETPWYVYGFGGIQIAPSQDLQRDGERTVDVPVVNEHGEQVYNDDDNHTPQTETVTQGFTENLSTDTDVGARVGAAIGYEFGNGFMVEAEQSTGYNEIDGDALYSPSAFVNGRYEFDTGTRYSPYLGAGVGASLLVYDGDTAFAPAAQGMAGVNVSLADVAKGLSLNVGARYVRTIGEADFGDTELPDGLAAVVGEVGIRYSW